VIIKPCGNNLHWIETRQQFNDDIACTEKDARNPYENYAYGHGIEEILEDNPGIFFPVIFQCEPELIYDGKEERIFLSIMT